MSIRQLIWILVLLLAATGSLLYGFGVFSTPPKPEMLMRYQPIQNRMTGRWIAQPTFAFSSAIRIKSLRVYEAADYADQKELALPVWALVGNPMSKSLRDFIYGQFIPNMKLEKPRERAVQLTPDHEYQLVLQTNRGELSMQFKYAPK